MVNDFVWVTELVICSGGTPYIIDVNESMHIWSSVQRFLPPFWWMTRPFDPPPPLCTQLDLFDSHFRRNQILTPIVVVWSFWPFQFHYISIFLTIFVVPFFPSRRAALDKYPGLYYDCVDICLIITPINPTLYVVIIVYYCNTYRMVGFAFDMGAGDRGLCANEKIP